MIPELNQEELELIAEDITNSCHDIAEKVEQDKDGEYHITLPACDLCAQISFKLIGIFLDDFDEMEEIGN